MDDELKERIKWWMNDMAYKPPEMFSGNRGVWYFYCMAVDVMQTAFECSNAGSASRLDPPQAAFA